MLRMDHIIAYRGRKISPGSTRNRIKIPGLPGMTLLPGEKSLGLQEQIISSIQII